jgi:hypothetical protein
MCACCGAKVSERRREDLTAGVDAWPGQKVLVTLTLQHDRSDSFAVLLEALLTTCRAMRSGAPWQRIRKRAGYVGSVTSLEVTHGAHGWHPHLHVLFFLDVAPGAAGDVVDTFRRDLQQRWIAILAKLGRYASHLAIDVRHADKEVAAYVAKFGREPKWTVAHELAKSASKNARGAGRSLAELLRDYALVGDVEAGNLWREAVLHLKGSNQHRWSPGLRARLLPGTVEKTDEELAEEQDDTAILLALLSLHQWRAIVANDARGELLAVARTGDAAAVAAFVAGLVASSL